MASPDEEEVPEESNSMRKRMKLSLSQHLPLTALRNQEYERLYTGFQEFNDVQSEVFTVLYNTDDNVLVAAPRRRGKTTCAEFAILRNIQKRIDSAVRVVYIAHLDPISKQRYQLWEKKFGEGLQMKVVELTGETVVDLKHLEEGQIIIATPERWDALSRHSKQRKFVQQVSLFIIDDIHLIGSNSGPVIEMIVARMKRISSEVGNKMRIVAFSTVVSNPEDLAEWINASHLGFFSFPLDLQYEKRDIKFVGFGVSAAEEMLKLTSSTIMERAKKPAIVYVLTTHRVRVAAQTLVLNSHITDDRPFLLTTEDRIKRFVRQVSDEILRDTLLHGVGFLHEGLSRGDQELVTTAFQGGLIQVCVMSSSLCWGMALTAHSVIVMGTDCYYNLEKSAYSVTHIRQMMGQTIQDDGKCLVLCDECQVDFYRKFLYRAFPLDSHFDHHLLHDNINAEIAAGVIKSYQEAVNSLSLTFMCQRLRDGAENDSHLLDRLVKLVDSTFSDLETSNCVVIDGDMRVVSPTRLGMIASYYYISHTTIDHFRSSLTSQTGMEGLLTILASAQDYAQLPRRSSEEEIVLTELVCQQRFSLENPRYDDPHLKVNALLQAHLSRNHVGGSLALDLKEVLSSARRLIRAMVYVISSSGWLTLTLLAMEVSQMVTQGMWGSDSMLLQLPHFSKELAKRCNEKSIKTVLDLAKMKADERKELLQMDSEHLLYVDRFSCSFSNIDLSHTVMLVNGGEHVLLLVTLEKDMKGRWSEEDAPGCPKMKEGWWLVVGDTESNRLLAIEGVSLQRKAKKTVKLQFPAPLNEERKKTYTLYCKSDSYLGGDQECTFTVDFEEKFFVFCS